MLKLRINKKRIYSHWKQRLTSFRVHTTQKKENKALHKPYSICITPIVFVLFGSCAEPLAIYTKLMIHFGIKFINQSN